MIFLEARKRSPLHALDHIWHKVMKVFYDRHEQGIKDYKFITTLLASIILLDSIRRSGMLYGMNLVCMMSNRNKGITHPEAKGVPRQKGQLALTNI
jgi:hypothetical protein